MGITGGMIAMLEPIALRDVLVWKRGETTAAAGQLMGLNGLTAENLAKRAIALLGCGCGTPKTIGKVIDVSGRPLVSRQG
ncbi:hypothetical protein [Limnothrix sp. PR1529]|uniref:hypothetical protein n=1 Tax=Limnothrix sp. PR1529 TaxID=1704291 RepID=UPI000C15D3AA|nr:hypothetical protein [Limnothrix sp. PR1529]